MEHIALRKHQMRCQQMKEEEAETWISSKQVLMSWSKLTDEIWAHSWPMLYLSLT